MVAPPARIARYKIDKNQYYSQVTLKRKSVPCMMSSWTSTGFGVVDLTISIEYL